jgi:hypothetical protein
MPEALRSSSAGSAEADRLRDRASERTDAVSDPDLASEC